MDDAEPASPGASHTHKPTDSMVTVSLSDIQSNSEHTQPDWRSLDIPPTSAEEDAPFESEANSPEDEELGPTLLTNAVYTPPPIEEEEEEGEEEEEVISESDSDLDDLDWEHLDRTEEQEPRGEGSDDVRDRSPQLPSTQ
jgi:hypothetical protein